MKNKIEKWGDSLTVRIPDRLAKILQISEGSEVELRIVGKSLVIQPKLPENPILSELVDRIFPENLHREIDL